MMKKHWGKLAIVAFGALLMVGCGTNNTSADKKESSSASSEVATTKDGEVTFYVVRHGKTMLNTTDRVQGWSDAVLTHGSVHLFVMPL